MNSDAVITVTVDRRAVRDAAIALRHETLISLAICKDIIERMDEVRQPEVRDAPR